MVKRKAAAQGTSLALSSTLPALSSTSLALTSRQPLVEVVEDPDKSVTETERASPALGEGMEDEETELGEVVIATRQISFHETFIEQNNLPRSGPPQSMHSSNPFQPWAMKMAAATIHFFVQLKSASISRKVSGDFLTKGMQNRQAI